MIYFFDNVQRFFYGRYKICLGAVQIFKGERDVVLACLRGDFLSRWKRTVLLLLRGQSHRARDANRHFPK